MGRLRQIDRTAVFAWSPGSSAPLVATGTRAGAVGEDFSSETKLELWDLALDKINPDAEAQPLGSITTDSGFNDIAWSKPTDDHPLGVIAGALENGSIDLWDAAKLKSGKSDAFISRTSKHSGAAKALQWNPYRHNLLASVGAKGEIFIYDLANMANPFRLGATAARADDIECLDWNKQEKTAHILATGSSGGFVTVWDVKQKRDILTLNNQGRKAVSAVAWDPEESTKLATATPNDQEPLIYLWSLRNSSAPERTLKGHELGVLGLSWCFQDPELLLSCGKDNRTICWNPRTGERYGDFAAGSNWAFQTEWHPHNPNILASASFDGKILITSTQSTNTKSEEQATGAQALDGEDFFAKAKDQPQGIAFNLPKTPKWNKRPSSVAFGFGGKLVRVSTDAAKKSKVTIDTFAVDSTIGDVATKFEEKLQAGDLTSICEDKVKEAKTDEEKADWQVIETLNASKSRKKLREYIGFEDSAEELATETEKLSVNGTKADADGDDDFFNGAGNDDDNFLANLASTKGAKTNSPFHIYGDSESEADKNVTRALLLGKFEQALDICLKEDRMSDAFMIAVCGGQKCIDKAQNAYLKKKSGGPNYLRLLASVVGKNLWDVVYNADLKNWKDVFASLCTYADETEFPDLCEALGDRLEEASETGTASKSYRRDASFCYLVGSKLEKVVLIWIQELKEREKAALEKSESDNDFSVHVKCLQEFIEKVSVFRRVSGFKDDDLQATEGWKLAPLYSIYSEYADILAAHAQIVGAERYLTLIPAKFEGANASQDRIKLAGKRALPAISTRQPATTQQQRPAQQVFSPINNFGAAPRAQSPYTATASTQPAQAGQNPYAPPSQSAAQPGQNPYAPAGYQPPNQAQAPYAPSGQYGGYQPHQQTSMVAPPPNVARQSSPAVQPASVTKNMTNWNDMPEGFIKQREPKSRRGTPGPQPVSTPFAGAQPPITSPPISNQAQFQQPKAAPLPPPPKVGESLQQRVASPPNVPQQYGAQPSSTTSPYAPAQSPPSAGGPTGSTLPAPMPPPVARGASPYQPPPSTSSAAPSNRYAPAPGSVSSPGPGGMPPQRTVAPNPYAAQQPQQAPYAPTGTPGPMGQTAPPTNSAPPPPPPKGPPRGPPLTRQSGPPRAGAVQLPSPAREPEAPAQAAPPTPAAAPAKPKYPRGDRSHIPASAQPIVDILAPEVTRIKSLAPQTFKPQVDDMDKRISILFDHLNNEDLLQPDTVQEMVQISEKVQNKDWEGAQTLFVQMQTAKAAEGTNWMVGIKRLIALGKATTPK